MASREELQLLKDARIGNAQAQTKLGNIYLVGSKGLPQNRATALHWLAKAATQGDKQAIYLIGEHIPFEISNGFPDQKLLQSWYQEALDNGIYRAGLSLAQIVLNDKSQNEKQRHATATQILELVAHHDIPDAQWMLAELTETNRRAKQDDSKTLVWTEHAAQAGILDAKIALAEHNWEQNDQKSFLENAYPIAQTVLKDYKKTGKLPNERTSRILLNCAKALAQSSKDRFDEIHDILELVATNKNTEAAYLLGLWYAKIDEFGARTYTGNHATSFKRAIQWLTFACEHGMSKAWYALSAIYQKSEFAQRDITQAQKYLETAANLGHAQAQYELGVYSWRTRRDEENRDIQAIYWLQKANINGHKLAQKTIEKIAKPPVPANWAIMAEQQITREIRNSHPFLVARIELAAVFGLNRAEALLLDVHQADQEHCLLIDISNVYRRSKRHIVTIQTGKERQTLSRIRRLFENVDCSFDGPEGNYRQRQYRLRMLFPEAYKASETTA